MTHDSAQEIADRLLRENAEQAEMAESIERQIPDEWPATVAKMEAAKPVGRTFSVGMPIQKSLRKRFGRKAIEKAAMVHFFVFLAANADTKFGYEWDLVPGTLLMPVWEDDSALRGPGARILKVHGQVYQVPIGQASETGFIAPEDLPQYDPENPHGGSPDQP